MAETVGFVKNCYIEGKYEMNVQLFKEIKDPLSGIVYAVAFLDGYSVKPKIENND